MKDGTKRERFEEICEEKKVRKESPKRSEKGMRDRLRAVRKVEERER